MILRGLISGQEAMDMISTLHKLEPTTSCHNRAIQGYAGGDVIRPELMGHVTIPLKWKESLYQMGSSFNINSILQAGLISGGKGTKEGRQTVFFTPLDSFGEEAQEKFDNDLSWPRQVHYNR